MACKYLVKPLYVSSKFKKKVLSTVVPFVLLKLGHGESPTSKFSVTMHLDNQFERVSRLIQNLKNCKVGRAYMG